MLQPSYGNPMQICKFASHILLKITFSSFFYFRLNVKRILILERATAVGAKRSGALAWPMQNDAMYKIIIASHEINFVYYVFVCWFFLEEIETLPEIQVVH